MSQLDTIRENVRQVYSTLALMGVVLIGLGVLVVLYPPVLFALVSIAFVFTGASMLYCAWKVYSLWQKLPGFIKNK